MTPLEIEKSALHGDELPNDLDSPEQCLFLSFRRICRDFQTGNIDKEQASREKQRILKSYDDFKRLRDIYVYVQAKWNKAEWMMPEVEKSKTDCPTCEMARKIIRIIDGREK